MRLENTEKYFEKQYTKVGDPFFYKTNNYETERYALMHQMLKEYKPKYKLVFEPACSIGIFSEKLQSVSKSLLCADASPNAVQQTTERMKPYKHVMVRKMLMPTQWPEDKFDLIVLSDMLEYLEKADVIGIMEKLMLSLNPKGVLYLVNYVNTTHSRRGDKWADLAIDLTRDKLRAVVQHRNPDHRYDLLERIPGVM